MADNKGEEEMDPSANSDPGPTIQKNELSEIKTEAEAEPTSNEKDDICTESSETTEQTPTPASDGGDASSGAAVTAGAGTEGNESTRSTSGTASPADTAASTNADPVETEPIPAAEDAPAGGLSTEMSPPPTAPAATPVPAPINLLDTCAVCKQSLQNRDCEPKLLPCLHSFCLKCIPQPDRQVSVQVPGPHGHTDTHIVNVMRCSVCFQDYKQLDIIDNYFVKDTSDATSSSDEKSAQVCTSCEDNAGTIGFCVECGEWLCKTCVEAHQRVKITKDHTIRTKEDANTETVGTSGQRPVFCPIHKQEHLKLFCETCDTLTCRDCQLLEHKEHRYQFLEEAFMNQKGMIEATMAKLQEKKNFVHFTVSQVQSRLKELNETHKKVEHEIKIAVFTLINEINKKGKSLLQQLEGLTKERSLRLAAMHKDTTQLAHQIHHVLNFCHWAITTGSSTALLYSKRLILFQLRQLFKARVEPPPQSNGVVRFFCDPTFWAKNVVNLGNLVIEKPPPVTQPQNVMVGGPPLPPGQVHPGKHPGQINLAQLRLQHMQQAAFAQKQQHQQQQQQQQMQQMRLASQMSQQHPRPGGPAMPPRLISMQQLPRGPGGMNGAAGPPMFPSSAHHMRLPGPSQGRMPAAQPRHNGQPYPQMMQAQLQRQMSLESELSHQRFRFLLQSGHSNPGHAGPFPVASLHNANPTSPTSASMAGAHSHRGPTSPILGPIELIPSVTNPENLPCLPEIPPIQLEDAGSSSLGHLLSRYIQISTHQGPLDMNTSPGLSTHSPGSSGVSNAHTPARPSSTSSTGSRGSCSSSGRAAGGTVVEQVRVKQEPGTEEGYSCTTSLKTERGKDGRSACMMSSTEDSSHPVLSSVSAGQDALRTLDELIKQESQSQMCAGLNGSTSLSSTMTTTSSSSSTPLTNGSTDKKPEGGASATNSKEDDPNEDWCAVCINGGDLICCDRCPKVFHMRCHVPTIKIFPKGDFLCTFCRSLSNPEIQYCDENRKQKGEPALSPEDQRRCERLLLYIFCHELSVGFREPVSSSVPNYYKIIKQPMDLKKVKKRLQGRSSQFYQTTQDFVSDMRLIFKNCAQYNEMSRIIQVYDEKKQINNQVGSEMAISGKAVSLYFEEKLLELFPGQTFPDNPEPETLEESQNQEDSEDSDDDFVQPRRKRLKTDEKVLHIK
ncbi:E3 ubiquitin-protein ligase TRIM33 isoform X2 [Periophthalmus magnuspinnatus]|uniref:E3 ubiquitin-protein ligase TRIM33 isoform X2 n=1 Tax=Periophthalmus magnuspinnatus TaxID=409849 RepID=UPI0024368FC6|nr:E3 ubiquitin-protein ligase TRIM33 isoform X2 [Periophthalmus magnuspinnatus]